MSFSWSIGGDYDAWKTTEPETSDEDGYDPRDDEPQDLDEWRDRED